MKFARNQVRDVQQASKDTMRANFTSTGELNQLQDRLDQMRLQIDRVSARIERLEQARAVLGHDAGSVAGPGETSAPRAQTRPAPLCGCK